MPATTIDSAVLCEKVLGWTWEKDCYCRNSGGPCSWWKTKAGKDLWHTPDFLHNVGAAWMLAVAASKKYRKPCFTSYSPTSGESGAWFEHGERVWVAGDSSEHAAAITKAVWALVTTENHK